MSSSVAYINNFSWLGSKLGLDRMAELMERMGHPERKLRFVHLAGTNGKGSTACYIAGMLQAAGYKTGLHVSPFIHTFHERMQINGVSISDEGLDQATEAVRIHAEAMADHPTTFELVTAVAFAWFAAAGCDIVVLETGLGGTLDATNIIETSEVSVITPIGLDHTAFLGDTVAEIAKSKAGIIKSGGQVVTGWQQPEALAVLEQTAQDKGAILTRLDTGQLSVTSRSLDGQTFDFGGLKALETGLLGTYQPHNAALAILAVDALESRGFTVSDEAKRTGIRQARWPGRFELVGREPHIIVDGGHNQQGASALAGSLRQYFPGRQITFVTGLLADKDHQAMLAPLLELGSTFFTITPDNPRAMDAEDLAQYLNSQGGSATACTCVEQAMASAIQSAGPSGVVCYFGSLYAVGQVRESLGLTY